MTTKSTLLMLAAMTVSTLSAQDAKKIADSLTVPATLTPGDTLSVPTVPGADVQFLGADYEQIITADGKVRRVLSDTPVKVNFRVTKDGKEAFSKDYEILVKSRHQANGDVNAKPQVIPSILQWKGGKGEFRLGDKVKVYTNAAPELKELLSADLKAIGNCEVELVKDPREAQICFIRHAHMATKAPSGAAVDTKAMRESYHMKVSDKALYIAAPSDTGLMWGSRTMLQILKQTGGSVPCGAAFDVPRYQVRGVLFDIARTPYTLDDLRKAIDTMAWYKMNDLHLVINNNYIFLEEYVKDGHDPLKEAYTAFRLESKMVGKNGVPLTAQDLSFTKKEFRELIDYAKLRGVNIVPEFDTPGHALSFTKVRPDLIYQGKMGNPGRRSDHIDAGNPETLKFVSEVLDEYLLPDAETGKAPLDGCVIHVGADEFYGDSEAYRKYSDGLLKYVKSRGFTPRIWGSLTHKPGKTPVEAEGVEMNLWSSQWQDPVEAMNAGYKLINTNDGHLYIVPFAGYYWPTLNNAFQYEKWRPNYVGNTHIPAGHPNLIGATFAIWNDMCDLRHSGYGMYDIWDIFRTSTDVLSQRMWGTEQSPDTFKQHRALADKIGEAPGLNPLNVRAGDAPVQAAPATLPMQLNEKAAGPNYHLTAEVELTAAPEGTEQVLLSGPEGKLIAVMKDGTVGFRRDDTMEFSFGGKLPVGKKVKLELIGKPQSTQLLVDGAEIGTLTLMNYKDRENGWKNRTKGLRSTFVLPLQTVGESFNGKVHSLKVEFSAPGK
ncbi:MAG: family 20 glycosylhydrolase [Akkermansia sp.]|nr:family 20 glycosylhydrolase [Akkermansia sp.]